MTGADHRAQALGIPEERLMEHAGTAVAAAVKALAVDLDRWGTGPIVIFAGPGNNGGDGFVVARRLALAGADVVVVFVASSIIHMVLPYHKGDMRVIPAGKEDEVLDALRRINIPPGQYGAPHPGSWRRRSAS